MDVNVFELVPYAYFAVVVTVAFAVRGATGFGSGTVAVPLVALALPVQIVIPVISALQLFSNAEFSRRNWRQVVWSELLRIMPIALIGVLLGLYLFSRLDADAIAKGLGLFVITYSIYAMVTASRDKALVSMSASWPFVGSLSFSGGLVAGLFGGASAPFYVMYLHALQLTRDAFRATMTMIILTQALLRVGGYAGLGYFSAETLLITLLALPFMMLGGKLGEVIADRVSPMAFNRIVGVVLLVSGIALLFK